VALPHDEIADLDHRPGRRLDGAEDEGHRRRLDAGERTPLVDVAERRSGKVGRVQLEAERTRQPSARRCVVGGSERRLGDAAAGQADGADAVGGPPRGAMGCGAPPDGRRGTRGNVPDALGWYAALG
jgi:hypothetical protein